MFKIEQLLSKSAYPHDAPEIKLIETHISWVLLTGSYVYKIKKPVKFDFLDFSTFELRKHFCLHELELNRRFSKELYLDVVPLCQGKQLNFRNEGEIIDHAVKMKELPANTRLDILLTENRVRHEDISKLTEMIFDFHKDTEIIKENGTTSRIEKVRQEVENIETVRNVIKNSLNMENVLDSHLKKSRDFLERHRMLFEEREKKGFIKACHGDFRSANIFIAGKPFIMDCIEFNTEFTTKDVVAEIAFLAVDLESKGRKDLSDILCGEYFRLSRDKDMATLMPFFKSLYANVLSMVAGITFKQAKNADEAKKSLEECKKLILMADNFV